MSRFFEFEVVFKKSGDPALTALGIDDTGEDYLDKAMIDMDEIESFYASFKSGGTEKLYTLVNMRNSGDSFLIAMNYSIFKNIYKVAGIEK
jgi:hypothetical protein